ncbi:TetR/AcrR family transcriptional regulator C-terminal domain-containing protein [Streptomyces sp. NPDC001595]|uniref:TetR/AcrR family transcriptional regulator C-terminal domain-containing protein n=1 Tax=Streptomyces sp. NPDC001532 TaxID=3154520 RepID=UPI0033189CCE
MAEGSAGRTGGPGRRASDRGRYGRLSRERVLASALEIVDRDGLSGLSMRRLGAELGVEAMALYRYASGKDALLDGLVEAFCRELEQDLGEEPERSPASGRRAEPARAPDREVGPARAPDREVEAAEALDRRVESGQAADWRAELRRIALTTHRVALRHPHVVPLLATRLLSTPLARRPAAVLRSDERILALLAEAGLSERQAVGLHRAFTAWLLGSLLVELRAMDDAPEEPDPAFRIGLHRIPARELPHLRATALAMAEPGGPGFLVDGLDALLERFG